MGERKKLLWRIAMVVSFNVLSSRVESLFVGEMELRNIRDVGCASTNCLKDGCLSQPDPAATAAVCCNNLAPEAGIAQVRKMGKHFGTCFGDVLTHAWYEDVPVSWFFAAADKLIVPEVQ